MQCIATLLNLILPRHGVLHIVFFFQGFVRVLLRRSWPLPSVCYVVIPRTLEFLELGKQNGRYKWTWVEGDVREEAEYVDVPDRDRKGDGRWMFQYLSL